MHSVSNHSLPCHKKKKNLNTVQSSYSKTEPEQQIGKEKTGKQKMKASIESKRGKSKKTVRKENESEPIKALMTICATLFIKGSPRQRQIQLHHIRQSLCITCARLPAKFSLLPSFQPLILPLLSTLLL